MVGAAGFEPAAPCSQSRCATRLRYAPTQTLIVTCSGPTAGKGSILPIMRWHFRPCRALPNSGSIAVTAQGSDIAADHFDDSFLWQIELFSPSTGRAHLRKLEVQLQRHGNRGFL